jgi:hypothetical protein
MNESAICLDNGTSWANDKAVDSQKMNAVMRMLRSKEWVMPGELRLLNIYEVAAHRVENVDEHAVRKA